MPAKLERCVADVKAANRRKDRKKVNPWAVCVASTDLKAKEKKKDK
jgi:hypothetical protein